MSNVIITAAITGSIHTPTMSPYLPVTPKDIADNVVAAYEAGAAVAHIHVRNPENGQPISNMDYFREVASSVKSRCPIVLCTTTGGGLGMTPEQRLEVVPTLKPELASFNAGSMNFGIFPLAEKIKEFKYEWEKPYVTATEDLIFPNTFKSMRVYSKTMAENDTRPEMEVYDIAHVNHVAWLVNNGLLSRPVYLQFVMGIFGGIPVSVENLVFLYETARKALGEFNWSVAAAGKNQMAMAAVALAMGGNVRVGLEDSLYLEKGVLAKNNAEQVAKVARIARELGREPATPDEARKILGLKGLDKVNF